MVKVTRKLTKSSFGLGRPAQKRQAAHAGASSRHKTRWLSGLLVFAIVATGSFIYHLPASWVVQHAVNNQLIPASVQLNQVQGRIWSGQAQFGLVENRQTTNLGQVHWRLNGWALLRLQAQVALNLQSKHGGARGQLTTGLLKQQQITLSELEGRLSMVDLQPLLPAAYRNFGELKGQLILNTLGFVWDAPSNWLSALSGSLQFVDLDMMGIRFPEMALTPTLQSNTIRLDALGGGQGWSVTGHALVNLKNYQADFKMEADSAESMPDWSELFMQKNSPVLATFKQQGRF